jgi:cell division transport system permease protein
MTRMPYRSAARVPPLGADAGNWLLPWLIALMVYVAGLAGIGLVLAEEVLRASETLLSGRLTVQVPAAASPARIETVLAVLRQTPGIRSIHLLTPSETSRLLEPWLGSPVPIEELPLPHLIDAGLDPGGTIDLATLKQQLSAVVPDIRLDDYGPAIGGLRAGARPLQAPTTGRSRDPTPSGRWYAR